MIRVNCSIESLNAGMLPMSIEHPWRVGDHVQFKDAGEIYVVTEWCWHQWQGANKNAFAELKKVGE